jgi:S-adenosylmethionine:tRNA ribosyltransferase-isomerase
MRLCDLQYALPPELIAQRPAQPRDTCRLLVLHRQTGRIEHRQFRQIGHYLRPGDALVLNNTRVIPARFFCRRPTGGKVEALFLRQEESDQGQTSRATSPRTAPQASLWRVLLKPTSRLKPGQVVTCEGTPVDLRLLEHCGRGEWLVHPEPPVEAVELLNRIGQTPLPPYIRLDAAGRSGQPDLWDRQQYQTVYARRPGAVAAPTAGLHFTPQLLEELGQAGIHIVELTLHIGLGTFAPIEVEHLSQHRMHAEWFEVPPQTLQRLRQVRAAGARIVAVGTTSVRALESVESLDVPAAAGWSSLFIYPPYRFRHVDALITNFHLPGSTLLALVMAFATPDQIRSAYAEAIRQRYRFYSYGDAMLIL